VDGDARRMLQVVGVGVLVVPTCGLTLVSGAGLMLLWNEVLLAHLEFRLTATEAALSIKEHLLASGSYFLLLGCLTQGFVFQVLNRNHYVVA